MRRKLWSWILTVAMIVTMIPASAFADGESSGADVKKYEVVAQGTTTDADGLFTSKTLELNEDGKTGTITLETYSKGILEENEKMNPADIVLVLDVSGSMDQCIKCGEDEHYWWKDYDHDFQSRIDALQIAVNNFIDTVAKEAAGKDEVAGTDDDINHQIAIVKFAGTKKDTVGDDTYQVGWDTRNNSQIVENLTSVKTGAADLTESVSALEAGGPTAADYGMEHAQTIISGISDERESNKVVVMFTDGEPNYDSGFSTTVANKAIAASKAIKADGAIVYTVGIFSSTMNSNVTTYMNKVSSNYPDATSMNDDSSKAEGADYYNVVSDTSALDKIFDAIKEELGKPQIDLTSSSVVQDVLTNSFELNGEGEVKGVTVKTAPYTGDDANGNHTWGEAVTAEGVTATVDGKKVSVTGFDFASEYILVKKEVPQGSKLIIEIPVELTDAVLNGDCLDSNAEGSGIYKEASDNEAMRNFGTPKVQKAVEIKYVAAAGGSVSSNGEIVAHDGTAAGSEATAADGYYFVNWTDEEGNEVSTNAEYVPPTEMAVYTANFEAKSELTIIAKSDSKKYDGEALVNAGYDAEGLKKGHSIESGVTVTGTITNAGTETNAVNADAIKIVDGSGKDVTNQYTVKTVNGTLKVTKRDVTLTSATDSKVYDGTPLTNDEITVGGDGFVKNEGAEYDVTGSQTNVGNSKNTFSYELKEGTLASNYNITTEEGTLTVTKVEKTIVITADSNTKMYDGTALTDDGYTFTEDVLVEGDELIATVEGSQTDAGEAANKVTSYKVMRGNEDVTGNYTFGESVDGTLKVTKRPVTMTSATDSKEYDGTPLTNDTVTAEGFVEGEGASYDVTGSQLDVGSSSNAFTYALNEGTKAENYEITQVEGTLTITKIVAQILITADSNEKVYDGTPLTDDGYSFDEEMLKNGDELTAVVEGSQKDAGTVANVVKSYKVMRGETDVTANYNIATQDGTLTVTKRPVTLTSATDSKEYDGTPLTNSEVTVGGDGFAAEEGASYDVTGSQLDVGSSSNAFTYALNEGTNADNYVITVVEGTLTVVPVGTEIVIIADSNTKMYDGTPLTDDGYSFDEEMLKNGDELTAVVEGSQKDAGTVANVVKSYKVMRGETDVTANYNIATQDGTLTVTKRPVTLTSATETKFYDGTPLTNGEITVGGDGFVEGEGLVYDVTGTVTNVAEGQVENEFTYDAAEGTDLNNYEITTFNGSLEIAPVVLTVTADSKTKFQGEENPELTGTITGFVNDEKAEDVLKGAAEFATTAEKDSPVGEYPITAGAGSLEAANGNYIFDFVDGTLTIVEKPAVPDDTAKTGDDFSIWMLAGLALMSLLAALAVIFTRKRQRQ